MTDLSPGSRVRFHGVYLKSTGQQVGEEGQKVFQIKGCPCSLCASGRFVLVSDPVWREDRHIAVSNLCGEHEVTIKNDP